MTYYIFLKSLRSLEEFRKNPHVKIPPKSPCANFQSLGKFKIPIFNSEILFPCFWPGRPCGPLGLWPSWPPLASLLPQAKAHKPAQAAQPACRWRICGSTFSLLIRAFRAGRLPLVSLSSGPGLSVSSSSLAGRLLPLSLIASGHPARPTSDLEMQGEVFTPRLDSPPP
jgi:hypothetical protein